MKKTAILMLIVAVFLLIADRFLKFLALESSLDYQLIGEIFRFSFVKNYYIAFSLPLGGVLLELFISLVIVSLLVYIIYLYKHKRLIECSLFVFTFLGATSNLFDRFKYGYVVDYLDLKYFTVFNLADAMIVGSVFALLLFQYWESKKSLLD